MTKQDHADLTPETDLIDLGEVSIETEGLSVPAALESPSAVTYRDN